MTTATAACRTVEPQQLEWRPARRRPVDRHAQLPGLRVHYQDYGGAGQPVILLHGLASSSLIWGAVAPLLAETNRVVALDQRGHGLSEKPATGYDFASVTADLAAFADHLGFRRPVIAGHSWGAHVALEYAARYPERAAAVVLVDGGLEAFDGRPWHEVERDLTPPDLTHLTQPELLAQVREWAWGRFWDDHVEATLLSLFEVGPGCRVHPRLSRTNHMQIVRALWEQRLPDVYQGVRAPVAIMPAIDGPDAEANGHLRARVAAAQARLPESTVRWFPDSSHDLPLQRPEELASAIESFLSGLGTDSAPETNPRLNLVPMAAGEFGRKLDLSETK